MQCIHNPIKKGRYIARSNHLGVVESTAIGGYQRLAELNCDTALLLQFIVPHLILYLSDISSIANILFIPTITNTTILLLDKHGVLYSPLDIKNIANLPHRSR